MNFWTRCGFTRRRRKTSSTPTSPATSVFSALASCRCANPETGSRPSTAHRATFDWIGTIPFEQLPQLHNPEIGFAFNANNANVPNNHQPTFGQDWEEDFRARRIQQFMDTIDKHSLDTSAAMQADHLSLAAKALQPFIGMIAPSDERARQAQAMLASWDGVMDKDRVEPLIFTAFLASLRRILLEEKTGLKMERRVPTP